MAIRQLVESIINKKTKNKQQTIEKIKEILAKDKLHKEKKETTWFDTRPAIVLAAENNAWDIVRVFAQYSPDNEDKAGYSIALCAALIARQDLQNKGQVCDEIDEVIVELITLFNSNNIKIKPVRYGKTQDTTLHLAVKQRESLTIIKLLVANTNCDVLTALQDKDKRIPLHIAANNQNWDYVATLVPFLPNNEKTLGRVLLLNALNNDQLEIANLLLLQEVPCTAKYKTTFAVKNVLHIAIEKEYPSDLLVSLIQGGASQIECNTKKQTPLLLAAVQGKWEHVRYLIQQLTSPEEALQARVGDVLLLALQTNQEEVANTIFDQINLHPKNYSDNATRDIITDALHLAIEQNCSEEILGKLIEHGASQSDKKENFSAIARAALKNHWKQVAFLAEHLTTDEDRKAAGVALLIAAKSKQIDIIKLLCVKGAYGSWQYERHGHGNALHSIISAQASIDIIQLLLDSGVSQIQKNREGLTPILLAVKYNRWDLVLYFSQAIGQEEIKDADVGRVILKAAELNKMDIVQILCEKGGLSESSGPFINALHFAIQHCASEKIIELLSNQKSMLTGLNISGDTPITLAMKAKQWETVKYLIRKIDSPQRAIGAKLNKVFLLAMEMNQEDIINLIFEHMMSLEDKKFDIISDAFGLAIKENYNNKILSTLLDMRASQSNEKEHWSPVLIAARYRRWEKAIFLAQQYLVTDEDRLAAGDVILLAAKDNRIDIIELLDSKGVKISSFTEENPLHFIISKTIPIEFIKRLLHDDAPLSQKNSQGLTPIMQAMDHQRYDLVSYFSEILNPSANIKCAVITEALHYAIQINSSNEILEKLIEHGASLSIKKENKLLIVHAAINQQWRQVEFLAPYLVTKEELDVAGEALMLAAKNQQIDTLKVLCEIGVKAGWYYVTKKKNLKINALHYIISNKDATIELIKLLIDCGASLTQKNQYGQIPLMQAMACARWDFIPYLAAPLILSEIGLIEAGRLVLKAAEVNQMEVVQILCEKGAPASFAIEDKIVSSKIIYRQNSLHFAIQNNASKEIIELLLKRNARQTDINSYGYSPIVLATELQQWEIVTLLAENLSNNDIKTIDLENVIYPALNHNQMDIVRILCQKGMSYNFMPREEGNLLHTAIKKNALLPIIELIIQRGTTLTYKNEEGQTPLVLAASLDQWEIVVGCMKEINNLQKTVGADLAGVVCLALKKGKLDIADWILKNKLQKSHLYSNDNFFEEEKRPSAFLTPFQYYTILKKEIKSHSDKYFPILIMGEEKDKYIIQLNDTELYSFFEWLKEIYTDFLPIIHCKKIKSRVEKDFSSLKQAFCTSLHSCEFKQLIEIFTDKVTVNWSLHEINLLGQLKALSNFIKQDTFLSLDEIKQVNDIVTKALTAKKNSNNDSTLSYLILVFSWYLLRAGYENNLYELFPEFKAIGVDELPLHSINVSDIIFTAFLLQKHQTFIYLPDLIAAYERGDNFLEDLKNSNHSSEIIIRALQASPKLKKVMLKNHHEYLAQYNNIPAVSEECLNYLEELAKAIRKESSHDESHPGQFSKRNQENVIRLQDEFRQFMNEHPSDEEALLKLPPLYIRGGLQRYEDIIAPFKKNHDCSGYFGEDIEQFVQAYRKVYGNGIIKSPFEEYVATLRSSNASPSKKQHFILDNYRVINRLVNPLADRTLELDMNKAKKSRLFSW